MSAPIVLLTDFGLSGTYVGQLKAVLYSQAPKIPVIDLCHDVTPQAVIEASFLLQSSYKFFPAGSIFLNIIDPGVGTKRALLAAQWNDHIFLAPDNGLLSFLIKEKATWWELYQPQDCSRTFHGRDILAPAAAQLALGMKPSNMAKSTSTELLKRFDLFSATIHEGHLHCRILHIDRFGNCLLDIPTSVSLQVGDTYQTNSGVMVRRVGTYAEIPESAVGLLDSSQGVMELAMNKHSCAQFLCLATGMDVRLTPWNS